MPATSKPVNIAAAAKPANAETPTPVKGKPGRKPRDPNAPPAPPPPLKASFGKQEEMQLLLIAERMGLPARRAAQMCLDYCVSQARKAAEDNGGSSDRWIILAWVGMQTAELERQQAELNNMMTASLEEAESLFP